MSDTRTTATAAPAQAFETEYAKLNIEQKRAVDAVDGPVMVIAGPGTGKTQILTLRIANIIRTTDTSPENILALTFTESGAHAMRKRLVSFIGTAGYKVNIHTFHGFANDIISSYPEEFPRIIASSHVSTIDQIRSIESILKNDIFEYIKPHGDESYYVQGIIGAIRDLKREGVTPEDFDRQMKAQQHDFSQMPDLYHTKGAHKGKMKGEFKDLEKKINRNLELARVYRAYQQQLEERKLYDFEDMIMETLAAFATKPDFLLELQEKYQYILADEHQDTNTAQNRILELLANFHPNPNIFIVGDEKQAIFRFQGASLNNFLYFKSLYPELQLIQLTDNYRSSQYILDGAHAVITQTVTGVTGVAGATGTTDTSLRQRLISQTKRANVPIQVAAFSKPDFEYLYLIDAITAQIASGTPADDIAILYRNNNDVDALVRYFEKTDIPFVVESDQDILQHPLLRKLITLLNAITRYGDDMYIARAMHIDFIGLSGLDVYKVLSHAARARVSIYSVITSPEILGSIGVSEASKMLDFARHTESWHSLSKNQHILESIDSIVNQSGMLNHILTSQSTLEYLNKLDALYTEIKMLVENHRDYTLEQFIEHIDILHEYDLMIKRTGQHLEKGVHLMTAHKSKGQEFEHVYIVGCYDGHWGGQPSRSSFNISLAGLEGMHKLGHTGTVDDERRLFYVALTRAKSSVTITYSSENREGRSRLPSQFVNEIDQALRTQVDVAAFEAGCVSGTYATTQFLAKKNYGVAVSDAVYLKELFLERGLSVTALNNYLTCPWQYFYQNLVRIPRAQNMSAMFGTAVHGALSAFFTLYKEEKPVSGELLVEFFEGELARLPLSDIELEQIKIRGREALTGYYSKYQDTWSRNIIVNMGIRGVQFEVDGVHVPLNGELDKVEVIDQSGAVNVVDYKTGKPKSRNVIEGATKDADGNYKRQLVFYKILLDRAYPDTYRMVSGDIDFIEPTESGAYKRERFEVTPEEVKELEQTIERVSREILNAAYWNTTCDDPECEYCAWRKLME